jgi:hypothetical protein
VRGSKFFCFVTRKKRIHGGAAAHTLEAEFIGLFHRLFIFQRRPVILVWFYLNGSTAANFLALYGFCSLRLPRLQLLIGADLYR